MSGAKIARPNARGEAVAGVVGGAGDMVKIVVVERDRAHDRTKDLLANDRHIGLRVGQHGRLNEITLIADATATGDDLCPLLAPGVEIPVTRFNCSSETSGPSWVCGSSP